jgi:ABC-type nitrate/sulfonate/bicarbonate transport system ATPase subunit
MGASLSFREVTVRFATGLAPLEKVSFDVAPGERVAVVARARAGKSTLVKAAAGFLSATEGSVLVDGAPAGRPRTDRFVLWHDPRQLLPWKTLLANTAYPLELAGVNGAVARARDWLGRVGLVRELDLFPRELSAEVQLRAAIARAFAVGPKVLLADDPFATLDAIARETLQDLLLKLQHEAGITLLFATRDPAEAVRIGQRVVVLGPGGVSGTLDVSTATAAIAVAEIRAHFDREAKTG